MSFPPDTASVTYTIAPSCAVVYNPSLASNSDPLRRGAIKPSILVKIEETEVKSQYSHYKNAKFVNISQKLIDKLENKS